MMNSQQMEKFMYETRALAPGPKGTPGSLADFRELLPFQREQVVRQVAEAEIRRLAEASDVPIRRDDLAGLDLGALIGRVEELRAFAPETPETMVAALREAGVPLIGDDDAVLPGPGDSQDDGGLAVLAAAGVPLRLPPGQSMPEPRSYAGKMTDQAASALLRESGVPTKEAAAASSAGSLERGPGEIRPGDTKECPTCSNTGIDRGQVCPDCAGTGLVPAAAEPSADIEPMAEMGWAESLSASGVPTRSRRP